MSRHRFPSEFFSGYIRGGHVQGIAVDEDEGYIYFSFTTVLMKFDFEGNVKGSVKGIAGHMGCITFDRKRRKIYGSLELKHDVIGRDIVNYTGRDITTEDAFYCVSFDCDKITRENMDAEKDGIMTAVYLPDVVNDYTQTDEFSSEIHRYGCSGIDGIALGPEFGGAEQKIMIAYGIYLDTARADNDHQIILQFSPDIFELYGKPLNQISPHHSGTVCEKRYFFYTGNTEYGIQNLEYDAFTNTYIAVVYPGTKDNFNNLPIFFIDALIEAKETHLAGRGSQIGLQLSPARPHKSVIDSRGGFEFKWGQTGLQAFGDGRYAFSQGQISSDGDGKFSAKVVTYTYDENSDDIFIKI